MDSLKIFKVGDFVQIKYKGRFYNKYGIVYGYNQNFNEYPRTILENGGETSWSDPLSLKKVIIDDLTIIEKLKNAAFITYNKKIIDNLTYIEILARLNELTKSKKSV